MYTGTVKHYDPSKKFGFLVFKNMEIFFHMSFGGMMAVLSKEPEHVPCSLDREPKIGETILFEYENGPRGLRVTKWAYPDSLKQALNQMNLRTIYRLVQRNGRLPTGSKLYNSINAKYTTLWEGYDLDALRKKFPKSEYPIIDEEFKATYFKVFCDGTWIDTEIDPR